MAHVTAVPNQRGGHCCDVPSDTQRGTTFVVHVVTQYHIRQTRHIRHVRHARHLPDWWYKYWQGERWSQAMVTALMNQYNAEANMTTPINIDK